VVMERLLVLPLVDTHRDSRTSAVSTTTIAVETDEVVDTVAIVEEVGVTVEDMEEVVRASNLESVVLSFHGS
jgi:hypothetical protein